MKSTVCVYVMITYEFAMSCGVYGLLVDINFLFLNIKLSYKTVTELMHHTLQ